VANWPEHDAAATVDRERAVIAQLENAVDESRRAELPETAKRLRHEWQEWQGADALHAMAFGEPTESSGSAWHCPGRDRIGNGTQGTSAGA
jgi:hypothetical protein